MLTQLYKKVRESYFKHNQWLELETMYEDNGKLTEQNVCLVDKKFNKCIFCTRIRTFKDLTSSELGWQPFLKYNPNYREFTITIPTFTFLTKADLANTIHHIVRENFWICFNIKIDGWNISEFTNKKRNFYQLDPDEIGRFIEIEKEK
jgi:hypothetical protein